MATLVFKLFSLTIKTVSKPLAARLNSALLKHPAAKDNLVKLANALHGIEVRITRGAEGKSERAFIADMDEENALQTAVALLIWETQRKAKEDEEKKVAATAERMRINELHEKHMEAEKRLSHAVQDLEKIMGEMAERLDKIEQQLVPKPQRSWSFR